MNTSDGSSISVDQNEYDDGSADMGVIVWTPGARGRSRCVANVKITPDQADEMALELIRAAQATRAAMGS